MLRSAPLPQLRRWNFVAVYVAAVFMIWTILSFSDALTQVHHQAPPPSVHLVLSTTSSNNYSWTKSLSLENYKVIPYIVNNLNAEYHTPANQGNEAMGYLTYMFEFYDQLPLISIFLHGQDSAWHVDSALQYSTSNTLNRLDLTEVLRRKYMNLRISWDNACPNWMNTSITMFSPEFLKELKGEEPYMKDAFQALFPGDPLPEILAAPCCSQFAVTRDTIRSNPRERYKEAMSWLETADLSSSVTGRIWEHLWHYLFLQKAIDCPDEHISLCRNYHICFETRGEWERWKGLEKMRHGFEEFRNDLLDEGVMRENRQVERLGSIIEDLAARIAPWMERATKMGEDEGRRRKIVGG